MKTLTENELKFIVGRVLSNAKDSLISKDRSRFENGKRLAYYEVLDTIKNELLVHDIDVSQFGLDINLEDFL